MHALDGILGFAFPEEEIFHNEGILSQAEFIEKIAVPAVIDTPAACCGEFYCEAEGLIPRRLRR